MSPRPERPSLLQYGLVIAQIGLTSFGGGVSAWMMRIVVFERGWISESEFLSGLALCQVFPGINVLNLSIWLGYRLLGSAGAVTGALVMIVPPGLVLLGLWAVFANLSDYAPVRAALNGVGAAAVGLTGAMGVRATRRSARGLVPALVVGVTFALVGVLHWPLVPVTAGLAALSVGLEAFGGARDA